MQSVSSDIKSPQLVHGFGTFIWFDPVQFLAVAAACGSLSESSAPALVLVRSDPLCYNVTMQCG